MKISNAGSFLERRWVLLPLLIFILGQVISLCLLASEKDRQEPIPAGDGYQYFVKGHAADPPWSDYIAGWNGQAYREIATNGYPDTPPTSVEGYTLPNPWAFFPLYPSLVRLLMLLGLPFSVAAVGLSLACGAAAVTLLFGFVRSFTGGLLKPSLAVGSLVLWPTAPLFQLAYPEALASLFLVGTLAAISTKRYAAAAVLILLLGLTRPVGPPDFVLVALHGLYLARGYLWPLNRLGAGLRVLLKSREGIAHLVLMGVSGFSALMWPLITRMATGENAFFEARAAYSGQSYFGQWARSALRVDEAYPLTPIAVALFFLLWALLQLRNRSLPGVLRAWPLILLGYILAVTGPSGNEERYLMLGFFIYPWMNKPSGGWRAKLYWPTLVLAIVAALYLQYSWVHIHWVSAPGELRKVV